MAARGIWRRIKRDYGPYLPLSPYLFVVLFPFYWMVITAFKRDRDLYNLETAPFWF
jgi:multiple sugar transport system permease protein